MKSGLTQALIEGVPTPLVLIGTDERIAAANGAARGLLGEQIIGRHYGIVMRQPGLLDRIEATLRHGQAGVGRHVIAGPSREVAFSVTVSPLAGQGVLCAFEDISAQEHIGQMRRDFVANVSHELRTPLTALLGFIETLQGAAREDPVARERFLEIMAREAGRMNRLVHDLLSLSRVEAEERVRPTSPVDLAALIGTAVAALRPVAEAAGVQIEVTGTGQPAVVAADADQMSQVLHNLIGNAVKYGGSGGHVLVRLTQLPHERSLRGPAVRIEVVDRGEGIDPIHLPRLSERFYRVDAHRSREKGGTGLGLAIVKHIVNRHRGRFRIESELGRGSVFTVLLPQD